MKVNETLVEQMGAGTNYQVVVTELVKGDLPPKTYLPLIWNSKGSGGGAPQVGPGFYLTHLIPPNQQSIIWCMYYYTEGQPPGEGRRVAMRESEMSAPLNPYPALLTVDGQVG